MSIEALVTDLPRVQDLVLPERGRSDRIPFLPQRDVHEYHFGQMRHKLIQQSQLVREQLNSPHLKKNTPHDIFPFLDDAFRAKLCLPEMLDEIGINNEFIEIIDKSLSREIYHNLEDIESVQLAEAIAQCKVIFPDKFDGMKSRKFASNEDLLYRISHNLDSGIYLQILEQISEDPKRFGLYFNRNDTINDAIKILDTDSIHSSLILSFENIALIILKSLSPDDSKKWMPDENQWKDLIRIYPPIYLSTIFDMSVLACEKVEFGKDFGMRLVWPKAKIESKVEPLPIERSVI